MQRKDECIIYVKNFQEKLPEILRDCKIYKKKYVSNKWGLDYKEKTALEKRGNAKNLFLRTCRYLRTKFPHFSNSRFKFLCRVCEIWDILGKIKWYFSGPWHEISASGVRIQLVFQGRGAGAWSTPTRIFGTKEFPTYFSPRVFFFD